MEADWTAEIGPGLAIMDADWPGFIDLRRNAEAIHELPEAGACPGLAEALAQLNAARSPVFTCKCDAWALDASDLDPYEFDASASNCRSGAAAYIDVLVRAGELYRSFEWHEQLARRAAEHLRSLGMAGGRVDLVIRAAECAGISGFGITLYAAACAADAERAWAAMAPMLLAASAVTMLEAQTPGASSSIG